MLEIKNLTKIYRSKTGDEVRALDNVSISFPESGMIFILGKSGSGKSTLLNVMGGLDSYDEGEFIIKGKSSKEFGGSDFDAYRNTFIGFIFQEYNVLDDFTVGANIGLALELQGKKATPEKINEILGKVDLLNYAKRKPNELSGGQKQRVAIARALVKEPQIIMADEPTGALDSNTGKQIFDTLKALSREKLVLIVSHDRDFAERYADRIVELSDGHIVSDVTKHEHQSESLSEGVDRINHNIFRIKGGYRLTAADLEMINAYLAKNSSDVLLSGDGRVNDELRSAVGISEKGTTAVFEGTQTDVDYTLKKYEKKDSKFIRSRLPMKDAVRIGGSGLKHKKFRLVMTILLSLVAFALFGFADTAAGYDKITATFESLMDSNVKNASVTVGVRRTSTYRDGDTYTSYDYASLNDADIEWLRNQTGMDFVPVYTGSRYHFDGGFSMSSMMTQYESNTVYTGRMAGLVAMSEESLAKTGFAVTGRLPQQAGEIAITELMYRQFNEYGFTNSAYRENVAAGQLTMNEGDKNSIIGKHLTLGGRFAGPSDGSNINTFVIVGIIDTGFDYDRYSTLLPKDENAAPAPQEEKNALTEMVLQNELEGDLGYGFHTLGFVTRESVDALAASTMMTQELGTSMNGWNSEMYVAVQTPGASNDADVSGGEISVPVNGGGKLDMVIMGGESGGNRISKVARSAALAKLSVTWLDGTPRTTLAANEVVIPSNMITDLIPDSVTKTVDTAALEAKIKELCGGDTTGWDTTDASQAYYDRLRTSIKTAYINAALNEEDMLDAIFEEVYRQATGEADSSHFTGNKKQWLEERNVVNDWINGSLTVPVPNLLNTYEVEGMADRLILPTVISYYGVTLPTDLSDEAQTVLENNLHHYTSLLRETSEESPTYTVEPHQIRDILRTVESVKKVYGDGLWTNQDMIDIMLSYNDGSYLSQPEWNSATEDDQKKDYVFRFYRDYYLSDDALGYEENAFGGKSGRVIADEADDIFMDFSDFDFGEVIDGISFEIFVHDYMNDGKTSKGKPPYTIVGYYDSVAYPYAELLISETLMDTYEAWYEESSKAAGYHEEIAEHEDGQWAFVIAPMTTDADTLLKLVEMSYDDTGDLQFSLQNSVMNTLDTFNSFIEDGAKIFLYIGIGFAVFSALLLMNFIATSISYKKREIGVLRAVGARSSDVFKIFFSEALIIAIINFILAVIAVIVAIFFTNNWMHNSGINITLLSFGVRQFILMLLVSVGVALLASFLPVYNIAKRKPIDAIRDR